MRREGRKMVQEAHHRVTKILAEELEKNDENKEKARKMRMSQGRISVGQAPE